MLIGTIHRHSGTAIQCWSHMVHYRHVFDTQANGLSPYLPGAGHHGGSVAHGARKAGALARSRAGKWDEVGLRGVGTAAIHTLLRWADGRPCLRGKVP